MSVLLIGLCAIEIIKNVKTSSVNIAYYTIQYLSLRRCTLSYNVVSVNSKSYFQRAIILSCFCSSLIVFQLSIRMDGGRAR